MPRSKEIPEDIRRQVVEAHESGKGYKLISKAIGLPKTTVRAILLKWKRFGTVTNLPRSGRPSKISGRARRDIIREVMKNPCTTSKDLQATLALSNICVHQSTIRRILGVHGRPTLSSFEGSVAFQSSSQDEDGVRDAADEPSRNGMNEEERQVLKNSNADSNNGSKDKAKCPGDHKEGDEDDGNGEKMTKPTNSIKEDPDDEMPSADGGGDVETTSTTHNGGGQCDDGGKGTETASTNPKCDVKTEIEASYSHDNGNDGNWSAEMDYISTLTFS